MFLKRKIKAIGGAEIETVFCVVVIVAIVTMALYYVKDFNVSFVKEDIKRTYILKMETEGYLSSSNITQLKQELSSRLGAIDINLAGTTMSNQVLYGEPVVLHVTGKIPVSGLSITGLNADMSWQRGGTDITTASTGGKVAYYVDFEIYVESTSKSWNN